VACGIRILPFRPGSKTSAPFSCTISESYSYDQPKGGLHDGVVAYLGDHVRRQRLALDKGDVDRVEQARLFTLFGHLARDGKCNATSATRLH
jgi:hypothetical protein